GEPHGVSSFHFSDISIVRSYCAARFPKSSRTRKTRAALSRHLIYTVFAALQAGPRIFLHSAETAATHCSCGASFKTAHLSSYFARKSMNHSEKRLSDAFTSKAA
ncbi:MAG: hypothetical protein J6X49_13020, partial [Victivallales bacterium]|nr:hypothetical protein [Victivallales bacterium]